MADKSQPENDPNRKPSPRKPHRVSKPGWKAIFVNTKESIAKDHLSIVAAGVAFYAMLAVVPALVAAISIYGLVADPNDIQEHFAAMEGVMPEEASGLLQEQMSEIAAEQGTAGLGAIFGILLALWAGSRGTKATMEALNITYNEEESRGFIKLTAIALVLTLALVAFALLAIGVIAVVPNVLGFLPLPDAAQTAIGVAIWPLLLLIGVTAIATMYRYGPSRRQPTWKWLSWGSAAAAILWVIGSALFALYVANFGDYNETYGSLGAVVVLLLWFWVSAFVILLGAELDAAMEKQTEEEVLPE
jgi:membrane protein